MSASISYKLKNSLQGALAGGGDPATSPLYVFGPFLTLLVSAGVAHVSFGASIWLAVFTVVTVSAMYRYVMIWVTDGSGGSGLSEEELGSWAVKTNAAITVIEYTLTFLVSIAALVTFIVDRIQALNIDILGISLRTIIAIVFSILIAVMVNRGPKISAKIFGPATALILLFLWLMVGAVIVQHGFSLPNFDWRAFDSEHLHFTLGGFARILALMTGIEIFANLVASYEGSAAQRSKKAFGSLIIVMVTTLATMIIVGPAILDLSNPLDTSKSVFTQTMDAILPPWLSYGGTLIGIAVLLSAAAASAQGIQNLALGLRARHYIPASWGRRNQFDVPTFPVWAQTFIIVLAFALFGTHEETYLALYAAGVFILLSMTGWSAFKRFIRFYREKRNIESMIGIGITLFSAICATFATAIIFEERFMDGAWSYLVMVPVLYFGFDFFRKRLGPPPESIDTRLSSALNSVSSVPKIQYKIKSILVPLKENLITEVAFYSSLKIAAKFGSTISALHVVSPGVENRLKGEQFVKQICDHEPFDSSSIEKLVLEGDVSKTLISACESESYDLICLASTSFGTLNSIVAGALIHRIIYATTPPVLLFRPTDRWISRSTAFKNILVPLDGSAVAEQVLPYVCAWANQYDSKITLLTVPEDEGHAEVVEKLKRYLEQIKTKYFNYSLQISLVVDGSGPARTILQHVAHHQCDLIAMVSHGRGGLGRQDFVKLGSVTEMILKETDVPMLFVSARELE
jgi:nucleotide-binding universal stress UspA family protein/amino acid transporter